MCQLFFFSCSEEKAKDAIFYSYKRNINGFAALLGEDEAAKIAGTMNMHSCILSFGLSHDLFFGLITVL